MSSNYTQQLKEEWMKVESFEEFGISSSEYSEAILQWFLSKHNEFVKAVQEEIEGQKVPLLGNPEIMKLLGVRNDVIELILSSPLLTLTEKE